MDSFHHRGAELLDVAGSDFMWFLRDLFGISAQHARMERDRRLAKQVSTVVDLSKDFTKKIKASAAVHHNEARDLACKMKKRAAKH